jgi:hypothetical protein
MASVMISANEARQNPIRESVVHDEARAIESAILTAVRNGLYQTTVTSGSPMTSGGLDNITVQSIDISNDQIYVPNHPFKTGDLVTVYTDDVLPAPLNSTDYYSIIYIDKDHVKLASSSANAFDARPIEIDFTVGVISIVLTNPGAGYFKAPVVSVEPSITGDAATAIANLASWGSINSIDLQSSGQNYVDVPSITLQPKGSGASVNVIKFSAISVSIADPGTNYRVGDILSVVGGTGVSVTVKVTSVSVTGEILTASLNRIGSYTTLPNLSSVSTTALPGGGAGCTLNLNMGIGAIEIDPSLENGSYGTGYVSPPVVSISGGNGTGAEAEAIINAGQVVKFKMLHSGSGYTAAPMVTLSTGFGAVAQPILTPTGVGNVTITNNGDGFYNSTPTVRIDPIGDGATAGFVTMRIVSAIMTSSGSGYVAGEILLIAGGAGSDNATILVTKVGSLGEILGFSLATSGSYTMLPVLVSNLVTGGSGRSAAFNLSAGVNTIAVTYGGVGYTVPPHVTITSSNGVGSGVVAKTILSTDEVSDIVVMSAGTGYTAIPTVSITSGSGATAVANLRGVGIQNFSIINSGSGYESGSTGLIITGNGSGVEYTIEYGPGGTIDNIIITNPGYGFTAPPLVTVTGAGIDAQIEAFIYLTAIESVTITNPGENYTSPPNITFSNGPATAITRLSSTTISRVDIIAGGANWTSLPTVYFVPGPVQNLEPISPIANANIGYSVKSISVTYSGSGYDAEPSVYITPPAVGGTPATAISYIGAGTGTMVLSGYADSRDYYKVWKNQTPSNALLTRPYQERMDSVIAYFTSMGYTITRQTNSTTGNTIQWSVLW